MSHKWSSSSRSPNRFGPGISSSTFSTSGPGSGFAGIGSGFSSRVPAFKPPSFYAAAAGLPVSPRAGSSASNSTTSSSYTEHGAKHKNTRNDETHYPLEGTPRSYPTAAPDALEDHAPSRKRSLSRSLSRAIPKSNGSTEGGSKEQDRLSRGQQMADIPFLETQLLPSLRDTIDKMTHPTTPHTEDHASKHDEHDEKRAQLVVSQEKKHSSRSPVVSSGYMSTSAGIYARSTPTTPAVGSDTNSTHMPYASDPNSECMPRAGPSKIPSSSRRNQPALRVDNITTQPSSVPNTPYIPLSTANRPSGKSMRSAKLNIATTDAALSPQIASVSLSFNHSRHGRSDMHVCVRRQVNYARPTRVLCHQGHRSSRFPMTCLGYRHPAVREHSLPHQGCGKARRHRTRNIPGLSQGNFRGRTCHAPTPDMPPIDKLTRALMMTVRLSLNASTLRSMPRAVWW